MSPLKTWLSAKFGRGAALARHLHRSPSFVNNMATGRKPIPVELGARIESFTEGEVDRRGMFPESWRDIWPELAADDNGAATQPAELGAQGNGEGSAGHTCSVGTQLPLIHHHEGGAR